VRWLFLGPGGSRVQDDRDQGQSVATDHQQYRARQAEAHVVSQTRQIISTEARLTSRDGRVLAHGTSTLMVVSGAK
jgi:hypothetical protein